MTGFNVVRYEIKQGMEDKFLKVHENITFDPPFTGFKQGHLIKTGDLRYCYIGKWDSAADSSNAESRMVEWLDQFRDTLVDQGPGTGVTDFISGDSIFKY